MSSWLTGTRQALDFSCSCCPLLSGSRRFLFAHLWPQWPPAAPSHRLHLPPHVFFPSFFLHLPLCPQCTPSCGPGYRHRVVLCKSGESGDNLPESKCPKHGRPTSRVRCNLQRCPPPQWVTGPWGEVRLLVLFVIVAGHFLYIPVSFFVLKSNPHCLSVLPGVVWVRRCVRCSVWPTPASRPMSVWNISGQQPCSSARANVTSVCPSVQTTPKVRGQIIAPHVSVEENYRKIFVAFELNVSLECSN